MSDLLVAARSGDRDAFTALVTPHLRALHLHCYRMLGSYADADEALQDTLLRAWKSFGTFADRAPLPHWLYRISTTTCLKALQRRGRQPVLTGEVTYLRDVLVPHAAPLSEQEREVLDRFLHAWRRCAIPALAAVLRGRDPQHAAGAGGVRRQAGDRGLPRHGARGRQARPHPARRNAGPARMLGCSRNTTPTSNTGSPSASNPARGPTIIGGGRNGHVTTWRG